MTNCNNENFKRYAVTEKVLIKYRSNAKQSANIDLDCLERKLSAIIENSFELKFNSITHTKTFHFGDLHIETNESDMIVTNIYWTKIYWTKRNKSEKISMKIKSNLVASYLKFGLNEKGDKLVSA